MQGIQQRRNQRLPVLDELGVDPRERQSAQVVSPTDTGVQLGQKPHEQLGFLLTHVFERIQVAGEGGEQAGLQGLNGRHDSLPVVRQRHGIPAQASEQGLHRVQLQCDRQLPGTDMSKLAGIPLHLLRVWPVLPLGHQFPQVIHTGERLRRGRRSQGQPHGKGPLAGQALAKVAPVVPLASAQLGAGLRRQ